MVKKVNNMKTTYTNTSDLVKKADYDTKSGEIEKKILDHNSDKFITTQEFNKLTADNFAARLTLFRMGGGGEQKGPPTSFFPVTSTNVGISPQDFLTYSFNRLDRLM